MQTTISTQQFNNGYNENNKKKITFVTKTTMTMTMTRHQRPGYCRFVGISQAYVDDL